MTSREALVMKKQPKSILIVGASAIGMEFGYFLNALGTEVTMVEIMPKVLPVEDDEVSTARGPLFQESRASTCTPAPRLRISQVTDKGITAELVDGEKRTPIEADAALVAIGVEA